ncbi:uncharacterized protein LOC110250596 [Exaiptasia diaphana]|uniref:Uncharacterized protein n=1 Tax=Exaiptasia diaphana TaxID=2652724 RepID=A0A913Y0T3_EXADI|nr:uncharacterized protein LOC110250596 [Exaiptasia diaphana]KXJ07438.1 hypothetical protein AC249_AIPGENE22781 [Exaiptasia diaphana]
MQKWIGNFTAKRKKESHQIDEDQPEPSKKIKLPSYRKAASGYNRFCAEYFKSETMITSQSLKNKAAATAWRELTDEEKEEINKKAKESSNIDPQKLNTEEKSKLIKTHLKQIVKEVEFIEQIGGEIAGVMLLPTGEVCCLGSTAGLNFLSNNSDIDLKFRKHFACPEQPQRYTEKDLTQLFQKKYSELVGHCCGEVPWKRDNFKAAGMPEGIALKRPCFYGSKQIQAIMKKSHDIKFVFKDEMEEAAPEIESDVDIADVRTVLEAIVGKEVANRALTDGNSLIDEYEVEVVDLAMPQDLNFKLHMCEKYFTKDATLSVCLNLSHSKVISDLILPTYTTENPFWLFFCNESPAKIVEMAKKKPSSRISGHWFDLDPISGQYSLQKARASIAVKSIIKSSLGGIVYHQWNRDAHDLTYRPPIDMVNAINHILTQQGYL